MEEIKQGNLSVETYISKQETFLIELTRRLLQSETKVTILELGLQEMYKKNEELARQIEVQQVSLDQSVVGIKVLTGEKEALEKKIRELDESLLYSNKFKDELAHSANKRTDRILSLEKELKKTKEELETSKSDFATLKSNYSKVLAALEDTSTKLAKYEGGPTADQQKKPVDAKKTKPVKQDDDWVSGG